MIEENSKFVSLLGLIFYSDFSMNLFLGAKAEILKQTSLVFWLVFEDTKKSFWNQLTFNLCFLGTIWLDQNQVIWLDWHVLLVDRSITTYCDQTHSKQKN